ncbi:MBL fold metallo-hydrolase [Pelagicoccus sp. SDUM812003]|uniref:MBL fold metallo-hydrolase n=1 Tax=Pelagicoccus sp. SDUM812003 TaxID=3041267 RepID=UPI00280FE95F|nr:MBL fold metallo-hydrolase [Pelagicoccus sp. SDUM812003]MDQ8203199.1 MBL fold metallo-hydrolase [Pelagicoccus sp. SDUM812003]
MIRKLEKGLYQVRGSLVSSYLLVENGKATLIDGGFWGHLRKIERALLREGLDWSHVKAVLLTHGHLDHCYNVAEIVRRSGARVYGHMADESHFEGRYSYRGINRICGAMERLGKLLSSYEPISEDWALKDGQIINLWGGLEVVHLPGHTFGHCGFYSKERDLLFSGDLFATGWFGTVVPWAPLNSCPELFEKSLDRVAQLNPKRMLSNHCDLSKPETQRRRFWKRIMKPSGF